MNICHFILGRYYFDMIALIIRGRIFIHLVEMTKKSILVPIKEN